MNFQRLSSLGIALFLFLVALTVKSIACGLDWKAPQNHFDGVNERGNVSYWDKIGDLDLGDNLDVPLIMGFNSAHTSSSPYLGEGWTLPLLEANVVQINTKHFLMMLPDGLNVRLKRKDETSSTLTGQGGWMAELGQNTFTAWAKCGWKIVFTDGKITSITTPQNQQLTYVYQNGVVTEVDKNGAPVLNVLTDAKGVVSGLSFAGKQIGLKQGDKPDVETINGQNVVGHISQSLNQVTMADGQTNNYKFTVDSKLIRTLAISGNQNRLFSWDPSSGLIQKDGDWSYNIVPAADVFSNAQITRQNKDRQSEFWFDNRTTGTETSKNLDGVTIIKSWFTTGNLEGKVRETKMLNPDGTVKVDSHDSYNEVGQLIRTYGSGVPTKLFQYDKQGHLVASVVNGVTSNNVYSDSGALIKEVHPDGVTLFGKNGSDAWKQAFAGLPPEVQTRLGPEVTTVTSSMQGGILHSKFMNSAGKLVGERVGDSHLLEYKLNESGQISDVYDNSKLHEHDEYGPDKRPSQKIEYDSETGKATFTHSFTYNPDGRLQKEVIHDDSLNKDETVNLKYDDLGRLTSYSNSIQGTSNYSYDKDGNRITTLSPTNTTN